MVMFYIGTSGWQYWEWKGVFYPEELPSKEKFNFYQKHFDTVEINSTFYHFPRPGTLQGWYNAAKEDFIYSLKVWRRVTHLKRLKGIDEDLSAFFERADLLREKLGVLLYQLPPSLHKDLGLLKEFLSSLSKKEYKHTIEFRHDSWFDKGVFKVLEKYQVAYCIFDAPKLKSSFEIATAPFAYIRMHGRTKWYNHDYSEDELRKLAMACKKFSRRKLDVYVYFNNTAYGYAVKNAKRLLQLVV